MESTVYLETAAALSRQAGEIIRDNFGGELQKRLQIMALGRLDHMEIVIGKIIFPVKKVFGMNHII